MHKLSFFLTASMLFIQTVSIDNSPSMMSEIKAIFSRKAAIAKERALIAKNILRIPVGIFCTATPVFIFAHYAPHLVTQMNLGTLGAITFVSLGAFYAGTVGAEIGSIFKHKANL